jgi:hypothetical protein
MSFEEKSTWITGISQLVVGIWYLVQILSKAAIEPVATIDYIPELLVLIGASVGLTVVATVVVSVIQAARAAARGDSTEVDRVDERDRSIGRYAGNIGGYVLGVGMIPAMILAVLEVDHFWIAHAILAAFFASELIGATIKLVAYRRGF